MMLSLSTLLNTPLPVSAALSENTQSEEPKVIQIAIPDHNGNLILYTGENAQRVYNQLESNNYNPISKPSITKPVAIRDNRNTQNGMFTYKYRFVEDSSGTKWGTSKRVSSYAGNSTSVQQSKTINASTSVSWTINTTLSGKFDDAFTASVGSSWQNSSSFSEQFTINVASKKRVWLEFKPRLKYVTGEVQKYYTTRGPLSTTVIEERKSVSSTSPTSVKMTLAGKTFSCPDGAYVWKEDSNYNSN